MNKKTHRIATSRPVDKTASLVMSPSPSFGQVIDVESITIRTVQHAPLPTVSPPLNITFNLTNTVVGSLKVLGYAEDQGSSNQVNNKGTRWVVRCVCGLYEYRRSKSLRNPLNSNDKCSRCEIRVQTTKTHAKCNKCNRLADKLKLIKGLCKTCNEDQITKFRKRYPKNK